MTKLKSKPKAAIRSTARKTHKSKSRARPALASSKSTARPDTKRARIISMLRTPPGYNDRSDLDCYGLAAAFGARLPCRGRPKEARS
jgi:hypothetical protein